MTNDEIVIDELLNLASDIGRVMDDKGITNTGLAKHTMFTNKVNASNSTIYELIGKDYIEALNDGRAPGKFPPLKAISVWVATKLGITDAKQNKSVTYLISKKIAEQGTDIYKDRTEGIELEKLIAIFEERLFKRIESNSKIVIEQRLDMFYRKFKNI